VEADKTAPAAATATPERAQADEFKARLEKRQLTNAAWKLKEAKVVAPAPGTALSEVDNMDAEKFTEWMNRPENARRFHGEMTAVAQSNPGTFASVPQWAEYLGAAGQTRSTKYSDQKAMIPGAVFSFQGEGPAYELEASPAVKADELHRIDNKFGKGLFHAKPLSAMTDQELDDEVAKVSDLITLTQGESRISNANNRMAISQQLGIGDRDGNLTALYNDLSLAPQRLKALHQVKTLLADVPLEERELASAAAKPQPITMHQASADPEETQHARTRLGNLIKSYEDAASLLEDEIGEDTQYGGTAAEWKDKMATKLRSEAHALKQHHKVIQNHRQVDQLFQDDMDLVQYASSLLGAKNTGQPLPLPPQKVLND
jgi:hypothetical protein